MLERLGQVLGSAIHSLIQSILDITKFKPEQLKAIDADLTARSLNPENYENPEVRALVERLKKKLETSPGGLGEWAETVFTDVFSTIQSVFTRVLMPITPKDFESAKADAGYMTSAFTGFILLSAALDLAACGLSATLVRNVVHIMRLMMQTFGFDRYMDIAVSPSVSASLIPQLTYGYQAQFQANIPGPGDLITMLAKEAFEPDAIAKYGLDKEYPGIFSDLMAKHGYNEGWAKKYWFMHWQAPGLAQIWEMLHRGVIDKQTMFDFYRLIEITPYWRDKLTAISFRPYTRVDARRMWDYGVLDDAALHKAYTDLGYDDEHATGMVIFTKVYAKVPDLRARFKKGWINKEQLLQALLGYGMRPDLAQELLETLIEADEPERTADERDLTKAEIYAGVKKGVIDWSEGIEMLLDLGYDKDEAEFILQVRVGVAEGSPESYQEFKQWTQRWRKAQGLPAKIPDARIIEAERQVKSLTLQIENMRKEARPEEEIGPIIGELGEAEYRYHTLLVAQKQIPTL